MLTDLLSIGFGLLGLFLGGEWLVRSASRLATSFGIPALIIGLTVVALGTSAPELVVSVSAALGGSSDIAVGNVVGSNIANIGLILGIAAIIYPLVVHGQFVRREIPVMIAVSLLLWAMASDGQIGRIEGVILLAGYGAFTYALYRFRETPPSDSTQAEIAEIESEVASIEGKPIAINRLNESLILVIGLVLLAIGAQLTVTGASNIARSVGISELVIGLTLVAVGTSLPELVTSVIASIRKHSDIAVGNVVGSNIGNILVILGVTALIQPVNVAPSLLTFDFPVMIAFAVILLPFVLDLKLQRWQGALFVLAYGVFVAVTLT